ncbi:hypothetical protein V8E53_001022 [Lactarius tabidus]
MHSYETFAILVLALSAAFPAFSAPVLENRQQARANVDEREFGRIDVVIPNSSDDANTLNQRAPGFGSLLTGFANKLEKTDSLGKVLSNGLINGVSSGATASGVKQLLNDTRRDFDDTSGIDPSTPTRVFGHSLGVLPVIPHDENSTTTFFVPGLHNRSFNVGSTSNHSLTTLVSDLFENNFKDGIISGRSVRRDPSPFSLSSVVGLGKDLLTALGLGSGSGGSLLSRDDALSVSPDERRRGLIDEFKQIKDTFTSTIH